MPAFAQTDDLLFGFVEVALLVVDGLFMGVALMETRRHSRILFLCETINEPSSISSSPPALTTPQGLG